MSFLLHRSCADSLLKCVVIATLALLLDPARAVGFFSIDKTEAYCGSDAAFIGTATRVYFNSRPAMETCDEPAPKTAAQFAGQLMTCYPLFVEVTVKEYLFSSEQKPRPRFKLHMKFAPPEWSSDTIERLAERLRSSPHIYSVRFMQAYENDGNTWLMGYPRSPSEREYVLAASTKPPCKTP